VDQAVKYAAKKDVLLVHAAGNSSADNDATPNFPNRRYAKKEFSARNLLTTGLKLVLELANR
jgi:subtilisin family serine protease